MLDREKRLNEVYEHVHRYFNIHTKGEFADYIKYARAYISSAMNGNEKYLTDKLFDSICKAFPGVFDLDYLLTGKGSLLVVEEEVRNEELDKIVNPKQPEIPEFAQRLFDEAVRMQTRNELLERQCEKLIGELREAKSDNDTFIEELRKSKEFNDTLAAELKISRTQNENLITELRETRKELKEAINGIDTMKNQVSMIISQYSAPQQPAFPTTVNDDGSIKFVIHDVIGHDGKSKQKAVDQLYAIVPQGLIRGGHPGVTEEIVKQAVEAFKKKK